MNIKKLKKSSIYIYLIFLANIYAVTATPVLVSIQSCSECPSGNSNAKCASGAYCIEGSLIKEIKSDETPGATKFGKSGTPSGNLFFDADYKLITSSGTIKSIYYCTTSGCNLISEVTSSTTYFNSKYTDRTCVLADLTDSACTCKSITAGNSYYDTSSEKVVNCSTNTKCTLTSTTGHYIDSGTGTANSHLITCINNKCSTAVASSSKAEFYINSGLDKSSNPLIYIKTGSTYSTYAGNPTLAYLDFSSASTGDYFTNIITCQSATKCTSAPYTTGIFLGPAKTMGDSVNFPQLIKCSSNGCKGLIGDSNGSPKLLDLTGSNSDNMYFIDELSKKLIQCKGSTLSCELFNNDTAGKFYMNYDTQFDCGSSFNGIAFCTSSIISCNSSSKCTSTTISLDSNYIDGDTSTNLIICTTFEENFFCTTVKAKDLRYYYVNSGNTKGDYPLIYCGESDSTTICIDVKASTNGYYMTDNGDTIKGSLYKLENTGYLIKCSSETKCQRLSDIANDGFYVNAGVDITNNPLILYEEDASNIKEVAPKSKDSYLLDASSLVTNSYSNLIYCSSFKSCSSMTPKDGYYFNDAWDDDLDIIIICDKTGCGFGEEVQKCTVDNPTTLYPGNYCYQKVEGDDNDINLVVQEFTIDSDGIDTVNQNNITYVSNGAAYRYLRVNPGNFPGITTSISTLFEVKSNSVTRVIDNGVYIINTKYEQVDSMSGSVAIGSAYSVYVCSISSQLCTETKYCNSPSYLFDETNSKGYFCNEKSISLIDEAGYYVDHSYVVSNSYTPAVLKCDDSGSCQRYLPTETYFLNSGEDSDSKPLIYCSSKTCQTKEAEIGYYRAEFGESGVIVCTSVTNCKLSSLRYSFYINSGEDKSYKPVIGCSKSKGANTNCNTKKATAGYYLVQDNNNILINCKMSTFCEVEEASVGYYYNAANVDGSSEIETVIRCYISSYTNSVICNTEKKNEGYYLSGSENNVLINCMGTRCKTVTVENGIFRSAASIKTSVKNVSSQGRDRFMNDEEELINRSSRNAEDHDVLEKEGSIMLRFLENSSSHLEARATKKNDGTVSTLIICSGNVCNELTAEELNSIPVCTYNNEVCYLDNSSITASSTNNNIITSVVSGDYCTDASRSTLYFATETIVEYNDVISGVLSSSKTTTKNCIKASSQYASNLFTVGNNIYRVNDGLIMQVYDPGYYFININKNSLVYSLEIKEYNNPNVLLYKCDGASCRIMDKPTSDTYYTDITKHIIKYSVEEDKYFFLNKRENICTFVDNTCTPKYDIAENDFCITAEGYMVVAGEKIKSRESGKCFMSHSITENALAFSYNSVLYLLNSNAAKKVVTSGYYFAENNKYTSAEYRAFNSTTSGITLYGCIHHNCQIYDPQPDVYYFDMITNYLIQKKDDEWISPIKVGHIYVSIIPDETYIYSYTMSDAKELLLTKTNQNGYYYTIDRKMYYCDVGIRSCSEITDSAYILTNSKELYYCVVDSEGEPTECFKRICTTGQVYYIKNNYYKCTSGSFLELIRSKTCDHDEVVVINFPLIYSETFPIGVYNSISDIAKNNHYVPTQKLSRNSLETIQGVFTNCTYDAYEEEANYDEICMQNYVKLNQDNEPDICSVKLLGYTYCTVEDGDNPDKCQPSSAFSLHAYLSIWRILQFVLPAIYFFVFVL